MIPDTEMNTSLLETYVLVWSALAGLRLSRRKLLVPILAVDQLDSPTPSDTWARPWPLPLRAMRGRTADSRHSYSMLQKLFCLLYLASGLSHQEPPHARSIRRQALICQYHRPYASPSPPPSFDTGREIARSCSSCFGENARSAR